MGQAAELLPADRRAVPPQIFVVGISPDKKLFHEASPAFETNPALNLLQQALRRGLENYQGTAVLASRAAISQGVAAAAPVVPQTAQVVQPRAVPEMARKQQVVRKHFNSVLKLQMDVALAKAQEEMRNGEDWNSCIWFALIDTLLVPICFAIASMFTFWWQIADAANRGENAAADNQLGADGLKLHNDDSDCHNGCQSCEQVRLAAGWPRGLRLLKNPTRLKKPELEAGILHYSLKLDDPASGSLLHSVALGSGCKRSALVWLCLMTLFSKHLQAAAHLVVQPQPHLCLHLHTVPLPLRNSAQTLAAALLGPLACQRCLALQGKPIKVAMVWLRNIFVQWCCLSHLTLACMHPGTGGGSSHRSGPLQSSVPARDQMQHPGPDRGLENLLMAREQAISSRGTLPNSATAAASGTFP